MRKFTTDYARLVAMLADDLRDGRPEYALETAEVLLRFHPEKPLPPDLVSAAASLAVERRQFLLASKLYGKLAGSPDELSADSEPAALDAAFRLGVILSRRLLQPHEAKPWFEALSALPFPRKEAVRAELDKLERLFAFREPDGNPRGERQMVALAAFADLTPTPLCDRVADALGVPLADVTTHFQPHSGIVFREFPDADAASAAVDVLQDMGLPAFHFAASLMERFVPEVKEVRSLKPEDDKLLLTSMLGRPPVELRWEDVHVFAAAKVRFVEEKKVRKQGGGRMRPTGWGHYAVVPPSVVHERKEVFTEYIVFITREPFVAWLFDNGKGSIMRPYTYGSGEDAPPKGKEEWLAEMTIKKAENAFVSYGGHMLAYDGFAGDWRAQTFRSELEFGDLLRWFLIMKELKLT